MLVSSDRDNDSSDNRTESWMNSDNKISSISCKQCASASKYSESEKESKSNKDQNDSKHTIRPSDLNSDSTLYIESERKSTASGMIQIEIVEICFLFKNNKKNMKKLHSIEESKNELDKNTENYVYQYIKRIQEKYLMKSLENKSEEINKLKKLETENKLKNNLNLTSHKVQHTDDNSKYIFCNWNTF